jgi:hypothetical protein
MAWNIYFWIFGSLFIINIIYLVYLKIDQVKKENKLNERLNGGFARLTVLPSVL